MSLIIKTKKYSRVSAVEVIREKYERKAELKEKELELKKLELEIQKRRLDMEEQEWKRRWEMEQEERKTRLELESEERRAYITLLTSKVDTETEDNCEYYKLVIKIILMIAKVCFQTWWI